MKALFITQYFWPETAGGANRLTGLAKQLARMGHEVGVVTGMPNYPSGRIRDGYLNRLLITEELEGVKIFRSWLYTSLKKDSIRRLLNYFSFVVSSLWHLPRVLGKYEVVFVSSPPLFLGIAGLIYHWILRVPLVFDVRDIWPEVFVEMGELRRESLFFKVAHSLEEWIYKHSSIITVVTEGKRQALIERGIAESKVVCIPNAVDREFLEFPVQESLKDDLRLSEKFVVLYAGLIGKAQGIDIIFEIAAKTRSQKLHFLLVGEGVEKDKLIQEAERLGLENITFLPEQPREKILSYLRMANIVLVPLKSPELRNSVPSKLYEALAAGCPVVLLAKGESVELLQQAKTGLALAPDDIEQILRTFEELSEGKVAVPSSDNNYILENFTRDRMATKLLSLLTKLGHLS